MCAIRGTTFTHCGAFLYWLYRFCFGKKDSNGQDLILVPNENETEIRGLMTVMQKAVHDNRFLNSVWNTPKTDNARKTSISGWFYWLPLPRKLFAIITNVNDKEIFIIEEFCHYKNQGWFRPLTNLEWLHFPSLQMGTKPRRLGGRCWVVYPLLTSRSCRTSLAHIGCIDSQVFVFWDSKTITLWSA